MAKKGFIERERAGQLLRDVVISRVEPSSISEHPEFLYPCVYDMMALDVFVPTVSLYRLDRTDPSAFSNFIQVVKNSLSQVLSLYYPMAGKWVVTEDAWIRKLVCNDEGAVFVEAAVDYEMDNVLDPNDFNPPEELTGDHAVPGFQSTSVHKSSDTKEYPALIVQVARFKCGGVAVTLSFNHMTVDGFGFDRFLKAWSEILSKGQTSAKPLFDRSLVVSHLDKRHLLGIPPDAENLDDSLSSYFKFLQSTVQGNNGSKFFSIRKDAVERLRQKAKEEQVSDSLERPQRFTTFECVSAQLWRCFARTPKVQAVRVRFQVEGRKKWSNPPLPEDFVGNMLILTAPPMLPAREVTDKPLSFAAGHIHESVVKLNPNTSGELLDEVMKGIRKDASTEKTPETEKPENRDRIFDLAVTSWSHFDNFYNLDFGYGGPFFFSPCPCWMAAGGVTCFLLSPPRDKSENAVQLYLRGPLEPINVLLEDPEFVHLVS